MKPAAALCASMADSSVTDSRVELIGDHSRHAGPVDPGSAHQTAMRPKRHAVALTSFFPLC